MTIKQIDVSKVQIITNLALLLSVVLGAMYVGRRDSELSHTIAAVSSLQNDAKTLQKIVVDLTQLITRNSSLHEERSRELTVIQQRLTNLERGAGRTNQ